MRVNSGKWADTCGLIETDTRWNFRHVLNYWWRKWRRNRMHSIKAKQCSRQMLLLRAKQTPRTYTYTSVGSAACTNNNKIYCTDNTNNRTLCGFIQCILFLLILSTITTFNFQQIILEILQVRQAPKKLNFLRTVRVWCLQTQEME